MALESVTPVLTGAADGGKGGQPPSLSLLQLPEGTAALAFKPAYDGGGYVLRIRELDGRERDFPVELFPSGESLEECDLLERRIAEYAGRLTVRPFDIKSMLIGNKNLGDKL